MHLTLGMASGLEHTVFYPYDAANVLGCQIAPPEKPANRHAKSPGEFAFKLNKKPSGVKSLVVLQRMERRKLPRQVQNSDITVLHDQLVKAMVQQDLGPRIKAHRKALVQGAARAVFATNHRIKLVALFRLVQVPKVFGNIGPRLDDRAVEVIWGKGQDRFGRHSK